MSRRSRLLLASLALAVSVVPAADAQRLGPPQKRPKLAASADTNDATAYLALGTRELETAPDEAAAAFYWAARLDPSSADALYGRSVALAMRKATTLSTYLYPRSYKARTAKDMLVMDSLRFRALRLDPLFYPRFYTTAEYFWMTDEQQVPAVGPDIDSRGFHAQAGVMAVPRTIEVGLLFARIDGDTDVDAAELSEWRGVVGYYWQAHNLKLQADIGQLGYGANFATMSSRARQGLPGLGTRLVAGRSLNDTQVRVQLQLAF